MRDESEAFCTLYPVLIDDVKPPLGFRAIQAAKLAGWNFRDPSPEFKRFLRDLEGTLGPPQPGESLSSLAGMQLQEQLLSQKRPSPDTPIKPVSSETKQVVAVTPVDMVRVPKGPFLSSDEKTRITIDYDYWIDKYPVTNEKYRAFVEAGGYRNQAYWSPEGWQWKTSKSITCPEYWNDRTWNKPNHPVVGVSYYEAEAYAKWAGKRLPTEQEWEKAARGEDGREYPWGDEFDKTRCNSRESGINHTTPVTQYPNGVSPYGCYDMAGNVLEWCAGWHDESYGQRVVYGGCWNDEPEILRVWCRTVSSTINRDDWTGFRLVQDIS